MTDEWIDLRHGDCVAVMRTMPDASVDSIVTDPPYELGFMGRAWDASGIANSVEMWTEALRVLKPGGHLLAFSGSRTYHRMVCAIEDAGFEIRDQIMWVYGSGFPKSLDVSKAIDKAAGAAREVVGEQADRWTGKGSVLNFATDRAQTSIPIMGEPATDAARHWQGWGTALKPAHEPIVVARKRLAGTVAANVLQHGTGALNIDACRVHSSDSAGYAYTVQRMAPGADQNKTGNTHMEGVAFEGQTKDGRWPANLIHDGSEEVLAAFPDAPGQMADASTSTAPRAGQNAYGSLRQGRGDEASANSENAGAVGFKMRPGARRLDDGSAARFFYCAKADREDRNEGVFSGTVPAVSIHATMSDRENADWKTRNGNHHPTVKPTDLMAYLCRLVTPPGGVVLDPFMGSGSTGKAAVLEGFRFIGIDMTPEYVEIARARISFALRQGYQASFDLEAA